MLALVSALMAENGSDTFKAVQQAMSIWSAIVKLDDESLVSSLSEFQASKFETIATEDCDGKLLMSCTAVAYFYDPVDGFSNTFLQAQRLRQLINASDCSTEVKFEAEHLFAHYLARYQLDHS